MADTVGGNTRTTLQGIYKVVYSDGHMNPFPEQTPLRELIEFMEAKKVGEEFRQSVRLTLPGGVSYGGLDGGSYALDADIPAEIQQAKVRGSQFTLTETISYGAAKAARGGPESFKDSIGLIFEGMDITAYKRQEDQLMHGQSATGNGVVESFGSGAIVITEATWAPGIYIGTKGHRVAVWAAGFGTKRLDTTISSVDLDNRKLNLASIAGIGAGDVVLFGAGASGTSGQRKSTTEWNDGVGITSAITTSGSVYSIDNSLYEIWKASVEDAGGEDASFDKISKLLSKMFVKGAGGELLAVCSPKTWTNLISPELAVRRHDASYKPEKVTVGSEAIEFRHFVGKLKIIAHPMAKYSELFVIAPSEWRRIGSTEWTYEQDTGSNVKRIFLHLAGKNGFEVRGYTDNTPFTRRLGVAGILNNIVNS